ncbi:MAG: class I SAM-dependent methyltransferase [Candidatus Latescibacteria bacterium]|nr:class I SAM-dependent methyltransferase [Candidatus Latescibacterota bacterium]
MQTMRATSRVEEYDLRARYLKNDYDMAGRGRLETEFLIKRLISLVPFAPEDRVLDIGPGNGLLFHLLHARVAECHGVDPSPAMIERLQQKFRSCPNVQFTRLTSSTLPFPDKSFEKVVLSSVITYMDDRNAVLRTLSEVRRVSTDEAVIFIGEVPFLDEAQAPRPQLPLSERLRHKLREEGMVEFVRSAIIKLSKKLRVLFGREPALIASDHGLHFNEETFLMMCRQSGFEGIVMRTETLHGLSKSRNDYLLHPIEVPASRSTAGQPRPSRASQATTA